MRIPVQFEGGGRPYLQALVVVPALGRQVSVSFVVDTGADVTLLAEAEVARLGLDFSDLPHCRRPVGGISGNAEVRELPHLALLLVQCDQNLAFQFEIPQMKVLKARDPVQRRNTKTGTMREYRPPPINLFGVDLMLANHLNLNCDYRTMVGYLESS